VNPVVVGQVGEAYGRPWARQLGAGCCR
jgi:hypothetical protein